MRIELYSTLISDSDDPDILVGFVLNEWLQTPKGQFCKQNFDMTYHLQPDPAGWSYRCTVTTDIEPGPVATELFLKWPS